jgi:hypothetical protein
VGDLTSMTMYFRGGGGVWRMDKILVVCAARAGEGGATPTAFYARVLWLYVTKFLIATLLSAFCTLPLYTL